MFSPDGKRLAFASNRRDVVDHNGAPTYRATGQPAGAHDTNVFVADWVDGPVRTAAEPGPAERFAAAVAWLADDARDGRGVGTAGLDQAATWLEQQLRAIGVEPGAGGGFRQPFEVTTSMRRGAATRLAVGGAETAADAWTPLAFSASGHARAAVVAAGWGIADPATGRDDYKGKNVRGKLVVVHRFAPAGVGDEATRRRLGDLEYKAFAARQRGAVGLIVVDDGDAKAEEAPLPALEPRQGPDAGIPAIAVTRAAAAGLLARGATVELAVEVEPVRATTANIVGVIRAGAADADRRPGVLVIGAHYDHLGAGGPSSLDAGPGIHNGADDNASGTAALLEVARALVARRSELARDVWLVAFSAEEMGVLGSSYIVKNPPWTGPVVAMLNMDMVGRLRQNQLTVLGGESAPEWAALVAPACQAARVVCSLSGSGYGPSDHTPFYSAGAPVLHFFTGGHLDYHRASDDATTINATGGARVAAVVADVGVAAARQPAFTYKKVAPPPMGGDLRRGGASLGTMPSYSDEPGQPTGVLLSDVVPGGAAAQAGLKGGDRIIQIGPTEIRNVHDLMFVLQSAKPGEKTTVVYLRDGQRRQVEVTFGAPRGRR